MLKPQGRPQRLVRPGTSVMTLNTSRYHPNIVLHIRRSPPTLLSSPSHIKERLWRPRLRSRVFSLRPIFNPLLRSLITPSTYTASLHLQRTAQPRRPLSLILSILHQSSSKPFLPKPHPPGKRSKHLRACSADSARLPVVGPSKVPWITPASESAK